MCSIAGVACNEESNYLVYLALHALQHRGSESCGIASTDGVKCLLKKKRGLVSEVFQNNENVKGIASIGHTRYSTAGGDSEANVQPFCMESKLGWISIAHNGNLVDSPEWKAILQNKGSLMQSTTDTEIVLHLLAKSKSNHFPDALKEALGKVIGSYSILALNKNYMVGIRDPMGFRPLVYGKIKDSHVFTSETCALDLMKAKFVREINPGEMAIVDLAKNEITFEQAFPVKEIKRCVFELIYFSRPDSEVFDHNVYNVRKALGSQLAIEHPAKVDVVIPVPDSGIAAAIGYANQIDVPFETGIIRSHHAGRSFLQPKQSLRDLAVRLKLNPIRGCIEGKKLVVVDDSLVRGTTSKKIIKMLREFGAKEVHLRISSPPTISPCYYGIDTPHKDELIASKSSTEQIRKYIEADSLGYLSQEGLDKVTGKGFCNACFTGKYPTLIPLERK